MKSLIRLLGLFVLLPLVGCYPFAYYPDSPPPHGAPPPPPPTRRPMSYNEAVSLGTGYCQSLGYACAFQDAHLTGNNVWKVRFGTARGDGRGRLNLDYDAWSRSLLNADDRFHERRREDDEGEDRGHRHGHHDDEGEHGHHDDEGEHGHGHKHHDDDNEDRGHGHGEHDD